MRTAVAPSGLRNCGAHFLGMTPQALCFRPFGAAFLKFPLPVELTRHLPVAAAGTDLPQELVAVDAGAVTVGEADGDGVVAHRLDRLGGHRLACRQVTDL